MNPLLQEALGAIVRWVVAIGVGYYLSKQGVAIVVTFIACVGLLWSLGHIYWARKKLVTALATGQASTEEEIKDIIIEGRAPSVVTPKTVIPRFYI